MTKILGACVLLACFALAGCGGRDFIRPPSGTFTLGKTTYAQVTERMGRPDETRRVLIRKNVLTVIDYTFVQRPWTSPSQVSRQLVPVRSQEYMFHNDVLVGDSFVSSFEVDKTDFDETKEKAFVPGKTTRAEVIEALGRPNTIVIPPVTKFEDSSDEFAYEYHAAYLADAASVIAAARPGERTVTKTMKALLIAFDTDGRVLRTKYVTRQTEGRAP